MQRFEIVDLALQLLKWIDHRAQPRDFIDIGLRALAIIPKIRRGHPRLERGQTVPAVWAGQRNLRSSRTRDFKSSASIVAISVGMRKDNYVLAQSMYATSFRTQRRLCRTRAT